MLALLVAAEIVIYGSDLAVPLILVAAIAAVTISTKVPREATTVAHLGLAVSAVIEASVVWF